MRRMLACLKPLPKVPGPDRSVTAALEARVAALARRAGVAVARDEDSGEVITPSRGISVPVWKARGD